METIFETLNGENLTIDDLAGRYKRDWDEQGLEYNEDDVDFAIDDFLYHWFEDLRKDLWNFRDISFCTHGEEDFYEDAEIGTRAEINGKWFFKVRANENWQREPRVLINDGGEWFID